MGKKNGKAKPATKDLEPRTDDEVKGGLDALGNVLKGLGEGLSAGARKG
jgi:hypothetical protein